jgi:O-antigen/teichoic acid export membrane protein
MAGAIFKGAVIVIAMRWADRLVGLISTLVLARLLLPADFGIVAMASVTAGLVDVLLDMGVAAALIQIRGFEPDNFSTAWTLRLIQATLAGAIVAAIAPLASSYFHEARVIPVLRLMAFTMFVAGLENIGIVAFQKEMTFERDFKFFFIRRIVGFAATIALASSLRTYWALPLGALVGRATGVWLSYVMHPFRPRLTLTRLRRIWSFSQWMLIASVGGYVGGRLDRFLIGRRADAMVLGAYSLADEVAAMPSSELLAPVGRVLFPALVDARDQPQQMRRLYLLALALQTMIAIPAAIGLSLLAHEVVSVMLGARWIAAVPFVQMLALVYGLTAISHAAGYLLLTLGRVRGMALLIWTQIALFAAIAVLLFPAANALQLATVRLMVAGVGTIAFLALVLREIKTIRFRDIFDVIWRPLTAVGIMTLFLSAVSFGTFVPLASLLLRCMAGAIVYVAALMVLWSIAGRPVGGESYALEKIATFVTRR